jgi:hypothetical protein
MQVTDDQISKYTALYFQDVGYFTMCTRLVNIPLSNTYVINQTKECINHTNMETTTYAVKPTVETK